MLIDTNKFPFEELHAARAGESIEKSAVRVLDGRLGPAHVVHNGRVYRVSVAIEEVAEAAEAGS